MIYYKRHKIKSSSFFAAKLIIKKQWLYIINIKKPRRQQRRQRCGGKTNSTANNYSGLQVWQPRTKNASAHPFRPDTHPAWLTCGTRKYPSMIKTDNNSQSYCHKCQNLLLLQFFYFYDYLSPL